MRQVAYQQMALQRQCCAQHDRLQQSRASCEPVLLEKPPAKPEQWRQERRARTAEARQHKDCQLEMPACALAVGRISSGRLA